MERLLAEMRKAVGKAGRGVKTRHQLLTGSCQVSAGHCQEAGGASQIRAEDIRETVVSKWY